MPLSTRHVAGALDLDLLDGARTQLPLEAAELLTKYQVGAHLLEELRRNRGDVHGVAHRTLQEIVANLFRRGNRDVDLCLPRRCAQVRRADHVAHAKQRMVRRRRLLREHVEGGSAHLAGIEGLGQGLLVHDPAPGRVHDQHPWAHLLEGLPPQQSQRLLGAGNVDGDRVGPHQQLVEGQQLDVVLLGDLHRDVRIECDHPHAQAPSPVRHDAPDVAEPDHAESPVVELDSLELLLLPLARLHGRSGLGNVSCQSDEERDGVLGRGDRVAAGRVDDDDAPPAGGGHVHVVDADPSATDHLELLGRLQHLRRHLGAAANQQALRVPNRLEEIRVAEIGRVDDLDPSGPLENLEALGCQRIADQNLGHGCLPVDWHR
jgi:hypothetical protein